MRPKLMPFYFFIDFILFYENIENHQGSNNLKSTKHKTINYVRKSSYILFLFVFWFLRPIKL